ncbi:MAG: ABC-2 transporter permease [Lachnospiraceae bacterium]|nr:ABC-2 transporter permease [Lachnospiraceae bacterium]
MAGLFEKDLRLVLHRKQSLLLFVAVALLLGVSQEDGGSFVIGYITMLGSIFTISTFSYDEFDNGYAFLMTLPINPKTYVVEKYLFTGLSALISWGVGVVIAVAVNVFKGIGMDPGEFWVTALMFLPVCAILLSIMIPVQLKYGAEKSRIALVVVVGGALAIGVFAKNLVKSLGVSFAGVENLVERIGTWSPVLLVAAAAVVAAVVVGISLLISQRVMVTKEF